MIASTLFGFNYMRRQMSDDIPNGYLTELRTVRAEVSSSALEDHHKPMEHIFLQKNLSTVDFELIDDTSSISQSVFVPFAVMLLFAAVIFLVIMFRRHPAAVMTVAAASLLAAGAYNLLILFQHSSNGHHNAFDPFAPPKYE